jgi:ribose 5-phosphate isomerase B
VDVGTNDKSSCHYPDFAEKMASIIRPEDRGVLVCGSGIGISIAGVKSNLRCSVAFNEYTAKECRKLNCQVMALGDRVVTP